MRGPLLEKYTVPSLDVQEKASSHGGLRLCGCKPTARNRVCLPFFCCQVVLDRIKSKHFKARRLSTWECPVIQAPDAVLHK
jgi:hypothetical protein